jgi:hypothetical protein
VRGRLPRLSLRPAARTSLTVHHNIEGRAVDASVSSLQVCPNVWSRQGGLKRSVVARPHSSRVPAGIPGHPYSSSLVCQAAAPTAVTALCRGDIRHRDSNRDTHPLPLSNGQARRCSLPHVSPGPRPHSTPLLIFPSPSMVHILFYLLPGRQVLMNAARSLASAISHALSDSTRDGCQSPPMPRG